MTDNARQSRGTEERGTDPAAPAPQGHFAGLPYDLRRPTVSKVRSRLWNANDPRLFTPKAFGWGYDVNFYWVTHPGAWAKARRRQ